MPHGPHDPLTQKWFLEDCNAGGDLKNLWPIANDLTMNKAEKSSPINNQRNSTKHIHTHTRTHRVGYKSSLCNWPTANANLNRRNQENKYCSLCAERLLYNTKKKKKKYKKIREKYVNDSYSLSERVVVVVLVLLLYICAAIRFFKSAEEGEG